MKTTLATTIVTVTLSVPAIGGQTYEIIDIGALDDLTDTVPTPPTSTALAINDGGLVGGSSWVSGGSMSTGGGGQIAEPITVHAVLFDGTLIDIGVLGDDAPINEFPRPSAYVNSINGLGQAVGDADVLEDGWYHAFIHLDAPAYGLPLGMSEIPKLAVQAHAWAISDTGLVVGESRATDASFAPTAVTWRAADGEWTITNLGAGLGFSSIAYGVNDLDQVTGTYGTGAPLNESHAFLHLPEPAYGLPAGTSTISTGSPGSMGRDVNDLGQVVGRGPGWTPMIWLPEAAYGLPAGLTFFPSGELFDQEVLDRHGFIGVGLSEFVAISNTGVAVGNAQFAFELPNGNVAFTMRGFVWQDGVFTLTQDLLADDAGWELLAFSWDVNDAGQIVGSGLMPDDQWRGYVVTPVSGCVADFDGSGAVDGADLGLLLGDWGRDGETDLDGNGIVDGADLGLLLGAWGEC